MIVIHQLEKNNIPWDTFIANEFFTTPPSQHDQNIPSSSHPPLSTPPYQLVSHTSSPSQMYSPHVDHSSSPFYNPSSSSHYDSESTSNEEDIEATWANFNDVEPFPKSYRRGYRNVFVSLGVKGAMPYSSKKQVDNDKEKAKEPINDEQEDKHETEHEFQLTDLDEEDEDKITSAEIKGKEAKISELQANIEREKFVIDFLEQENQQLKSNQIINEVKTIKAQREAKKARALLEETLEIFGEINEEEDQPPRQKPETIGLNISLARERQREVELAENLTPSELLALEISKDRESWLDRANLHLERLLKKANKDNHFLRSRVKLHAWKEKIVLEKLKRANAKIEILTKKREKKRLDILVEVSLHASST